MFKLPAAKAVSCVLMVEMLAKANRPDASVTLTCPLHVTAMPAGDAPARSPVVTTCPVSAVGPIGGPVSDSPWQPTKRDTARAITSKTDVFLMRSIVRVGQSG